MSASNLSNSRRRLATCARGFALAMLLLGCGGPPRPAHDADKLLWSDYNVAKYGGPLWYLERARLRFDRGLYEGALADCDHLLSGKGKKSLPFYELEGTYVLRARTKESLKDYAGALADIDSARATQPGRTIDPNRYERGRLFFLLGRLGEAEAIAVEMMSPGPDSPDFLSGISLISQVYAAR